MLFIFKLQEVKIHLSTICFKRATMKKKKTQKIGIAGNTTSSSLNPTKISRKIR
jgi:DNA-binding Xre family transcriptional regulator